MGENRPRSQVPASGENRPLSYVRVPWYYRYPMLAEDTARHNLLAIADAYCEVTGRSLAAVSKDFYGNRDFFIKLKQGIRLRDRNKRPRPGAYSISLRKLDMVLAKFREKWPPDAPWPTLEPIIMGGGAEKK